MTETDSLTDPIIRSRRVYVYIREAHGMDTEPHRPVSVKAGRQPHV